ncbi:hypothetical protein H0H81_005209 [Sphagnurus paluster]|uniref:Uncharacterized protein n=1 Tax=Sphagnurus paluster TaxID=117069 RepID=A0A9P7KJU2_9AGAR|nr:hypothetical protein H0H81_005209 [Sphagnurus paluster]
MMSSPGLQVPHELIELIVDELKDDPATLTSCALVSPHFTNRSQLHLFNRVKITSMPVVERLTTSISASPTLASYINHLFIGEYSLFSRTRNEEGAVGICLLFEKLEKLRSFGLDAYGAAGPEEKPLTTSLIKMLNRTGTEELFIGGFGEFPTPLLAFYCPKLKQLELSRMDFPFDRNPPLPLEVGEERGCMESLTIRHSCILAILRIYDATRSEKSRQDLDHLQEIIVHNDMPSEYCISLLYSVLALSLKGSLKRLTWHGPMCSPGRDRTTLKTLFPLPASLLSLRFSVPMLDVTTASRYLRSLTTKLRSLAGRSQLRDIILVFDQVKFPSVLDASQAWDDLGNELDVLDSILGNRVPHLARVALFVQFQPHTCSSPIGWSSEWIKAAQHTLPLRYMRAVTQRLEGRLPVLRSRGGLSVQWIFVQVEDSADVSGLPSAIKAVEDSVRPQMGGFHAVGYDGPFETVDYTESDLKSVGLRYPDPHIDTDV